MTCTHGTRTARGDRMLAVLCGQDPLADPEVTDVIAFYRRELPEIAEGKTDAEMVARLTIILASFQRCAECGGSAS